MKRLQRAAIVIAVTTLAAGPAFAQVRGLGGAGAAGGAGVGTGGAGVGTGGGAIGSGGTGTSDSTLSGPGTLNRPGGISAGGAGTRLPGSQLPSNDFSSTSPSMTPPVPPAPPSGIDARTGQPLLTIDPRTGTPSTIDPVTGLPRQPGQPGVITTPDSAPTAR